MCKKLIICFALQIYEKYMKHMPVGGRFILMNNLKSVKLRIALAALVAGMIIGISAGLLKWGIRSLSSLCTSGFRPGNSNTVMLWVPIVGIVVAGLLARYVFRRRLEHATAQLRVMIAERQGSMSPLLAVEPLVASTVTLGCGGSAGSEGPIAFAGAAVASNLGKRFGLSSQQLMVMMACGAGAGIAAIFKAPVGGVLFTVEVLGLSLDRDSLLQLVLMCVTSALTCFAFSGFTPDMAVCHPVGFEMTHLLPTMFLGVVCGVYSAYYLRTGMMTRRALESLSRDWIRWIVAGCVLALALFCFPALYGEGYRLMDKVVNGDLAAVADGVAFGAGHGLVPVFVGILLVKSFACYATNSGGGVAGDFAPTLFAGCMAGALFALGAGSVGLCRLPVGNFAIAGMAGVMAGVIRAPFMAIFLTVEMCFASGMLFPVAICACVSYFVSRSIAA